MTSKRAQGISASTRTLLTNGEGETVDYKRAANGLHAEDLVSFANSKAGGTILIGVDEIEGEGGVQAGKIVGCDVSDGIILQIVNKALTCIPPVSIVTQIENVSAVPFLRIDIASSETKPHCTPKGVYCVRDGNRNRPLHPGELLAIFLESEGRSFAKKFGAAAERVTEAIENLEESLNHSITNMGDQLGWADSQLGDTESLIQQMRSDVARLGRKTDEVTVRLKAILRQQDLVDPIRQNQWAALRLALVKEIVSKKHVYESLIQGHIGSFTPDGKSAEELTPDELSQVFNEAVAFVAGEKDVTKYSVTAQKPEDYEEEDFAVAARLIEMGGEVVDGVSERLMNAYSVGMLWYDGLVVGCAALKRPNPPYRKKVFVKANATVAAADYPIELGWIFIHPAFRSSRQTRPLLDALLAPFKQYQMYATTRTTNDRMKKVLEQVGFELHGGEYSSTQNPGQKLVLLLQSQ